MIFRVILNTNVVDINVKYVVEHFMKKNTFVDKDSNISKYTKLRILESLKDKRKTFTSIAHECNVSVTKVIEIFDSLGNIRRKKLSKAICLDEYYDPATGIGNII